MAIAPIIKKLRGVQELAGIFSALADKPYSFMLDSSMMAEGVGEYSFLGFDPFLVFKAKNNLVEITGGSYARRHIDANPLEILRNLLWNYRCHDADAPLPLTGGAVGFFGYDFGRNFEAIPRIADDDLELPDCVLGFYDVMVGIEHKSGQAYIISTGYPEAEVTKRLARAQRRLEQVENIIEGGTASRKPVIQNDMLNAKQNFLQSNFNREEYCRAVESVMDYIAAGDLYQVNLSQRFCLYNNHDPWHIYQRLRTISPAPFAAYMNCKDHVIACSSPERFLKVSGSRVETRPIKGTRPRGGSPEQDRLLRDELWNSVKDRAELAMIVDMERNDLGRVCKTGSVRVPELYRLEAFATVFHLVSTVEGELAPDCDGLDLLRASFPGGSISGAPKIRAMEIIEELEPVRRGIYTGSLGYISFDGNMDLNIVIRTMIFKGDRVYFQVGGGITIDSEPMAEYRETLDKARALGLSLGLNMDAGQGENK